MIVDWVWEPVPDFTGKPPKVAMNTPLPVAVGDVTVAVYVPLELSVTDPIVPVPDDFVIVTVCPPTAIVFPFASLAVTVQSWVEIPSAAIDADVGVNVD